MEELIARLSEKTGLDPAQATQAATTIFDFLMKATPPEIAEQLKQYVPGAEALASEGAAAAAIPEPEPAGGLFGGFGGGLMGGIGNLVGGLVGGSMGDAMATLGKLTEQGLDMEQIKTITTEIIAHARATAGDELVDKVLGSIPALGQFVK